FSAAGGRASSGASDQLQAAAARGEGLLHQLGALLRRALRYEAEGAHVGDAVLLGVVLPQLRSERGVDAERVAGPEPRALADEDHRRLRLRQHADLVLHADAGVL